MNSEPEPSNVSPWLQFSLQFLLALFITFAIAIPFLDVRVLLLAPLIIADTVGFVLALQWRKSQPVNARLIFLAVAILYFTMLVSDRIWREIHIERCMIAGWELASLPLVLSLLELTMNCLNAIGLGLLIFALARALRLWKSEPRS